MTRGALIALFALGLAGLANAAAINVSTTCVVNQGGSTFGFTCNAHESNGDGGATELSNIFTLPSGVTAGWIVLMERPNLDQTNNHNWSDVLHLIDNGQGIATTGQLLSDGCTGSVDPFSCFPSYETVTASPNAFIVEIQTGTGDDNIDFTTFQAGLNTYNIFSAAPINENDGGQTPEPATMGLLGAGLCSLLVLQRRWRNKQKMK